MKPLFIPLKSEYFDAFARGEKTTEYRRWSARWCATSCVIGREVILSKGYGNKYRLRGVITSFSVCETPDELPGWKECYGSGPGEHAACIEIKVLR
ncbi:MAG: hypothetical protein ACOY9J_08610 [Pseudomonadota bacterium]